MSNTSPAAAAVTTKIQLSPQAIRVLGNFSSLNSGIAIKPGQNIRTMNSDRTVLAEAIVPDTFPTAFAIPDLRQLLNVMSSLCDKQAIIEFKETHLVIENGSDSNIEYYYGSDKLFITPPDKQITISTEDIFFSLSGDTVQKINKAASIFGSDSISIHPDPNHSDIIQITVHSNIKNTTAHTWSISLPGSYKKKFNAIISVSNLKILVDDYEVVISHSGISKFENNAKTLKYFIATEATSTF